MRKHWSEIDGLTSDKACEVLRELAAQVDPEQVIVEVGVFKAKSLVAMADAAPDHYVVGVDPWNLPRPSKPKYSNDEVWATVQNNVRGYPNIHLVRSFSATAASRWDPQDKIGLWYLDADHRKLPVLADFAAWRPHMAPACTVAFDDHHVSFPGVIEAVNCLWQKGAITRPVMATDRLAVCSLL